MKRNLTVELDNLKAFIEEAKASVNIEKDIKLIQKTFDLTQKAMAMQFGVSQPTINGWLKGEFQPKCKILIHFTAERIRSLQ